MNRKEYKQSYYQANKERLREYQNNYYQANKERVREYQREYYKKNRDHLLAYHRKYFKKHNEQFRGYAKKYRRKLKALNPPPPINPKKMNYFQRKMLEGKMRFNAEDFKRGCKPEDLPGPDPRPDSPQ